MKINYASDYTTTNSLRKNSDAWCKHYFLEILIKVIICNKLRFISKVVKVRSFHPPKFLRRPLSFREVVTRLLTIKNGWHARPKSQIFGNPTSTITFCYPNLDSSALCGERRWKAKVCSLAGVIWPYIPRRRCCIQRFLCTDWNTWWCQDFVDWIF